MLCSCPLHIYQHMLCSWPLHICQHMLCSWPLHIYQHMLCSCPLHIYQHMLCSWPLQNNQNILYPVANVDCTHVGSATASIEDLITLHKRALSRHFGRGSTMASFRHGINWSERELHKPNSRSKHEASIVIRIANAICFFWQYVPLLPVLLA